MLITIFTSHFTLSKRSVEESGRGAAGEKTNKNVGEETKQDLQ